MLTTEQLLKPRYKVIADYPKSVYEVGTIINAGTTSEDCIYCDREGPRMRHYPHLFQPLPWWSDREISDMPEYVKWDYNPKVDNVNVKGLVEKVVKWVHGGVGVIVGGSMTISTCHWLPATLADYEAYNQQKEGKP